VVRVGLQFNALSIAASCSPNDDQNRAGHDSTFVVARPQHHGVGSLTLEMTPAFSIRSSSSATLVRSGSGTCRGWLVMVDHKDLLYGFLSFVGEVTLEVT